MKYIQSRRDELLVEPAQFRNGPVGTDAVGDKTSHFRKTRILYGEKTSLLAGPEYTFVRNHLWQILSRKFICN